MRPVASIVVWVLLYVNSFLIWKRSCHNRCCTGEIKKPVAQLPPPRDSLCSYPLSVSHMADVDKSRVYKLPLGLRSVSVARQRSISGTKAELSCDKGEKRFSGGYWYLALPGQKDLWE